MPDETRPPIDPQLETMLQSLRTPLDVPGGFARRLLARLEGQPVQAAATPLHRGGSRAIDDGKLAGVRRRTMQTLWLRSGIAALLLLAVSFGGLVEHRRQKRIAGERARQQALLALRIVGSTWRDVQQKAAFPNFHAQTHQENQP
jgi:hypothetical protein